MGAHLAQQLHVVYERRLREGTIDMRSQRPAIVMLCVGIGLLTLGFVAHLFAQAPYPTTQDGLNAMILERMRAISERQDNVEGILKWIAGAIAANLGAHLFTIWSTRKGRDSD